MIEVLSGLLTPLIAVLVAYIAWQQWRTNHLRLKHELFDRRYAIFEKITSFVAEILVQGKVPANSETRLLRETKTAIFLFDKQIQEFTEDIYRKAADLHALEAMLENLQGEERSRNVAKQREIKDWFSSQLSGCSGRFSRFLSLGEERVSGRTRQWSRPEGWQRLGVVASVLWVLAVSGVSAYEMFRGAPFGTFIFVNFVPDKSQPAATGTRPDGSPYTITPVKSVLDYSQVVKFIVIPIVVGWLGVFVVVWIVRWIARGFHGVKSG